MDDHNEKNTFSKILIIVGCLSLVAILSYIFLDKDVEEKPIKIEVQETANKIPLYYEISNPGIIYTLDKNNNFVEVKLNG